ncbi:MAG TPA: sulfotransferase [Candidatus Saccharimonadales bacterium]|nr:sulfotransferase [Candidatus Saccharimonadales bacterium]
MGFRFQKKSKDSKQAQAPIIIYGPPRSGTTYLGEIVSQHPEVFISNEYRIFTWLHQSTHVLPDIDDMVLHSRKGFKKFIDKEVPPLIRKFYAQKHPHIKYWGDKNPFYGGDIGRLRTIAEYFPDAKFINIVRDGRDVVTSLMNKKWEDGRPWADFDTAHQVWNSNIKNGLEFAKEAKKKNHYLIKYEDLVKDDLSEAKKIFKFLEIDWRKPVEKYCLQQQKERTIVSKPVRDIRKDAGASLWADKLTKTQQKKSMSLLKENLKNLKYL